MTPVKLYQEEIHRSLGFFATWLPGEKLSIGDVGYLEGARFRKMASLAELQIPVVAAARGAAQELRRMSAAGIKLGVGGRARTSQLVKAKGSLRIDFSRKGAFLMHALNVQDQALDERISLANAILTAYEAGQWQVDWLLVDSVHTAGSATIFVSEDDSAGLSLTASVGVDLGAVSLADPSLNLSFSSFRGRIIQILAREEITPLYSCMKVEKGWFTRAKMVPVRGAASGPEAIPFVRPTLSELLNS